MTDIQADRIRRLQRATPTTDARRKAGNKSASSVKHETIMFRGVGNGLKYAQCCWFNPIFLLSQIFTMKTENVRAVPGKHPEYGIIF